MSHQIKLLLKFLVGVIDAELFERVDFKSLEPVNVEDANEASLPANDAAAPVAAALILLQIKRSVDVVNDI